MNFLSHYYFESKNQDSNMVIGTVLPDLVKNAQKDWNLHPQKHKELFAENPQLKSILKGWEKHLKVDLIFHSSDFFLTETTKLKQLLSPTLNNSPVRPSFLAHIGVELMLDHLLVVNNKINISTFYNHLQAIDNTLLNTFLNKCGIKEPEQFSKFFSNFKSSKYLFSYQKLENISYALQRICLRLWTHPFDEETVLRLTHQLEIYKISLKKNYLDIYKKIEHKLK